MERKPIHIFVICSISVFSDEDEARDEIEPDNYVNIRKLDDDKYYLAELN
ncbi:MAG: hypothetical protein ACOC4B_02200 [Bacteroidota bacterium]